MSLNLDPGTFGGTPACHILVEKLNAAGDGPLASAVVRRFNQYFEVLGELLKLNNPTRSLMIKMHYEATDAEAREVLEPRLESYNIPYSYFHNVLLHRRRQAQDHGAILERFRREEREHADILHALRMLAKSGATIVVDQIDI